MLSRGLLILVVDDDKSVGPPARHAFREKKQRVGDRVPVPVEMKAMGCVGHLRSLRGWQPPDCEPADHGRNRGVRVDDIGPRLPDDPRDFLGAPLHAGDVEHGPGQRELVQLIERSAEAWILGSAACRCVHAPAQRSKMDRIRTQECSDRARDGRHVEQ